MGVIRVQISRVGVPRVGVIRVGIYWLGAEGTSAGDEVGEGKKV